MRANSSTVLTVLRKFTALSILNQFVNKSGYGLEYSEIAEKLSLH